MLYIITMCVCSRRVYSVYNNERAYATSLQDHCCASVKRRGGNIQRDFLSSDGR